MTIPEKPKDLSLVDYLRSMVPGELRAIPVTSLNREDTRYIQAIDPLATLMQLVNTGSDRDIVITAVGMLEWQLSYALSQVGQNQQATRFPSLGSMIDRALELGLLDENHAGVAHALRKVRNAFAHDAAVVRLDVDDHVISTMRAPKWGGWKMDLPLRLHFAMMAHCVLVKLGART